jgi:hypothetical protein
MTEQTTFLTPADVAARTGLHEATIRWHCREEQGLLYLRAWQAGGRWLIPPAAVDQFIADHVKWRKLA